MKRIVIFSVIVIAVVVAALLIIFKTTKKNLIGTVWENTYTMQVMDAGNHDTTTTFLFETKDTVTVITYIYSSGYASTYVKEDGTQDYVEPRERTDTVKCNYEIDGDKLSIIYPGVEDGIDEFIIKEQTLEPLGEYYWDYTFQKKTSDSK